MYSKTSRNFTWLRNTNRVIYLYKEEWYKWQNLFIISVAFCRELSLRRVLECFLHLGSIQSVFLCLQLFSYWGGFSHLDILIHLGVRGTFLLLFNWKVWLHNSSIKGLAITRSLYLFMFFLGPYKNKCVFKKDFIINT